MINMSAGVTNNLPIFREVFTIPQAAVQTMQTIPSYPLIITNNSFFCIPIYCYIYVINQTTPYTGFNHLHLVNTNSNKTNAIISENATLGGISNFGNSLIFTFVMNVQQGGFFNGWQANDNLGIGWDTLPTAGDGDMVVTLFYTINELF